MGKKLKEILTVPQQIISNTKLQTTMSMAFNEKKSRKMITPETMKLSLNG